MPWQESSAMEERRFVAQLLESEGMSDVCREFGISCKTGYKIWRRYREEGTDALCHGSIFALETGEPINPPSTRTVKTYRVKEKGGHIYLVL